MTVYIHVKQPGRKLRQVEACPYELQRCPGTLRELIRTMVQDGVQAYNQRLKRLEPTGALSADEIEGMYQVGKIAFGICYANQEANAQKAVETAISGYEDGLYRFFINETEITQLDTPLQLHEKDAITIIRLVMLTGGFF